MSTVCTRCQCTGFLNTHQIDDKFFCADDSPEAVLQWMKDNPDRDVQICDCCGDGENWYGIPGEHYNSDDLPGPNGPYASNGGLCHCH